MQNIENINTKKVEQTTRGQSLNPLWQKGRSIRLTASYLGIICGMRPTCTENLVNTILYAPKTNLQKKANKPRPSKRRHLEVATSTLCVEAPVILAEASTEKFTFADNNDVPSGRQEATLKCVSREHKLPNCFEDFVEKDFQTQKM